MKRVVGLGGGIGASRLWRAIASVEVDLEFTVIVNTADDLWLHGLRVCPDLDTVLYALSGRQDDERGWGVRGETWRCRDALEAIGGSAWFELGDVDLATHLYRTGELRRGTGLGEVTTRLARSMGVTTTVLPATEDEIATTVITREYGPLHYEEYYVRYGAAPAVVGTETVGLSDARPAPGVLQAISEADVIVVGPSNPVASVLPILGVHGVADAIRTSAADVVAVTPIVENVAIDDPGELRRAVSRAALLQAHGHVADPAGVAALYRGTCRRFVVDEADSARVEEIAALGFEVMSVPTLLHRGHHPASLLEALLHAGVYELDV